MVRLVGAAACAAVLVWGCSWDYPVWPKNKKSDTALFRFVIAQHNGAGYIDRNGKVIIQPTLDGFWNNAEDDFFDGLAKIRVNQELWFIDATGRRVFRAHGYGRFSEGFASQTKDGKSGYVNCRGGEFVVPPTFDSADEFSEGLAVVGINRIYGYIGKDGSVAIPLNFSAAMAFSDGAARVIEQGNCLYVGYGPCAGLNPMVLPYDPQRKQTSDPPRCRYSYIDKTGRRLFEVTSTGKAPWRFPSNTEAPSLSLKDSPAYGSAGNGGISIRPDSSQYLQLSTAHSTFRKEWPWWVKVPTDHGLWTNRVGRQFPGFSHRQAVLRWDLRTSGLGTTITRRSGLT
jgi:hypothetical protein